MGVAEKVWQRAPHAAALSDIIEAVSTSEMLYVGILAESFEEGTPVGSNQLGWEVLIDLVLPRRLDVHFLGIR